MDVVSATLLLVAFGAQMVALAVTFAGKRDTGRVSGNRWDAR